MDGDSLKATVESADGTRVEGKVVDGCDGATLGVSVGSLESHFVAGGLDGDSVEEAAGAKVGSTDVNDDNGATVEGSSVGLESVSVRNLFKRNSIADVTFQWSREKYRQTNFTQ